MKKIGTTRTAGPDWLRELVPLVISVIQQEKGVTPEIASLAEKLRRKLVDCVTSDNAPDELSDETEVVIDTFLDECSESENTRKTYGTAIRRLRDWSEKNDTSMFHLKFCDVDEYMGELTSSYKLKSVRIHMSAIRKMYDWLMRQGFLHGNPAPVPDMPTDDAIEDLEGAHPLTINEVQKLLSGTDCSTHAAIRNRAIMGLIVYAQMPLSSMIALKRSDYFLQDESHFIKFNVLGRETTTPLHPDASAYIDKHLENAPDKEDGYLFTTCERTRKLGNRKCDRQAIYYAIINAGSRAGISEKVTPVRLRMTGILALAQSGCTYELLRTLTGNRTAKTMERYMRRSETAPDLAELFDDHDITQPLQTFMEQSGIFSITDDEVEID